MEGATFQPKIFTREEDLEKLRDESFYEGVPSGFKVTTMRFKRRSYKF